MVPLGEKDYSNNMKTALLSLIFLALCFPVFCQNTLLNDNVIILGEKHFEEPISIELLKGKRAVDSCHTQCDNYNDPHLLLIEKKCFDTLKDYSELSVFNPNCYLYIWYFFPRLVRDNIIPYMDKNSEIYQRVNETYPNLWVTHYDGVDTNSKQLDFETFYYRTVSHNHFLIVLMNAKTFNEYLSHISPPKSYYKDTYEENGIYFKVAIPIPEK